MEQLGGTQLLFWSVLAFIGSATSVLVALLIQALVKADRRFRTNVKHGRVDELPIGNLNVYSVQVTKRHETAPVLTLGDDTPLEIDEEYAELIKLLSSVENIFGRKYEAATRLSLKRGFTAQASIANQLLLLQTSAATQRQSVSDVASIERFLQIHALSSER